MSLPDAANCDSCTYPDANSYSETRNQLLSDVAKYGVGETWMMRETGLGEAHLNTEKTII
jgi:hypothetical protein